MNDIRELENLAAKSLPFFKAIGDPVRQQLMIEIATDSAKSVKALTAETDLSRPTISHHLRILKDAKLIIEVKKGREIFYQPQEGEYFYEAKALIERIDEMIKKEKQL